MMLKGEFYTIESLIHLDESIVVQFKFNAGHAIFAGHFPGQPVVPGACMLQMVKEVLNDNLKPGYRLQKAGNLKFIAPVDPLMSDELELKLTYKTMETGLQVTGTLTADGVVCFKMQGVFA